MKKIVWEYFKIELKRGLQVFGKSAISILLVLICSVAGVAVISHTLLQSRIIHFMDVAVVIPQEEDIAKLAFQMISGMESVESVCTFHYMDEEEAFHKMDEGEVQAIIVLPDNFYEDMLYGVNTPATIYFPQTDSVEQKLFREILKSGLLLIQISESSVYSTQALAYANDVEVNMGELGNHIAYKFAAAILQRTDIYEAKVMSPFGGVQMIRFYYAVLMLFSLFMAGMLFSYLYKRENKSVEQKMSLYGVRSFGLSMIKISVMTLFLWGICIFFILMAALCSKFEFLAVLGVSGMQNVKAVFWSLLLAISIASFFHLIYSAWKDWQKGIVFLIISAVVLFLGSGLIVPIAYYPVWVQKLSLISPLGLLNRFQLDFLYENVSGTTVIRIVVLNLICIVTGTCLYHFRKKR